MLNRSIAIILVGGGLALCGYAAEPAPATAKAEAKVDKTVAKPKQDIQRYWVTPEFLMMWSKDGPVHDVHVLRSDSAAGGGFPLLDNPLAQRLFSNDEQDYGLQMGGRLTFGMWVDDDSKWGFELSGFALQEKESSWTYASAGTSDSGISLLDTSTGVPVEGAWSISEAGVSGVASISSKSQLWGVEGSGLYNFIRRDGLSLDLSFGVKHLDLGEEFKVENHTYDARFGAVTHQSFTDEWKTGNKFYGAKVGVKFNMTCWDRLLLNIEPGVSLGANGQSLDIRGSSLVVAGGLPATVAGGGFTGVTNLGSHDKTRFAIAPEIKLGLGCKITRNVSFNANYNFLYVSDVVRPGEQFDRRINVNNVGYVGGPVVAPLDPQKRFESSDYWVHGVGVNLKIKF